MHVHAIYILRVCNGVIYNVEYYDNNNMTVCSYYCQCKQAQTICHLLGLFYQLQLM